MQHFFGLVFLGLAMMLVGCSEQELYSQLTQRQANEMVGVLRSAGVSAEKEAREGNTYAVSTSPDNFSQAIEVLRASGLPREGYETLGQVFKKEGFVSSPLAERARLMYALSQEISSTIASIDGVVVARVHLSVPEKEPLAEKAPPSSASVFIKHRAGVDLTGQTGHIKALVVNALQGLAYEDVTVVLFPAEAWPVRAAVPRPKSLAPLWWAAGTGTLVLVAGGGLWWSTRRRPASRPVGLAVVRDTSMLSARTKV